MTIGASVFAVCDVRRTPGCAAHPTRLELDPVHVEDVQAAVTDLRAEALALGWASERRAGEPRHVCPACARAAANDWAHTTELWLERQAEQRLRKEAQRERPGNPYGWPDGSAERARRPRPWGDMMNRPPAPSGEPEG
jgi:hypothetical protein